MSARRLLFAALCLALLPQGASAAERANTMNVTITGGAENPLARQVLLPLDKAAIVELPADAKDVLITNPEIADVVIRTARRVYVMAKKVGQTNAFFFDADGHQILDLEIQVERDIVPIQTMIDRLLPDARVKAEALNDQVVLTGVAPSLADADRALSVARRFVRHDDEIVSLVTISGKEQVMLKVRIVEMQRTIAKQLGVNLSAALNLDKNVNFSVVSSNEFSLLGALGGLTAEGGFLQDGGGGALRSAEATLQALERVGLVRTLAEPNLTSISGEPAKFLAGGEFPVPIGQDDRGRIIIEYKPFGVGLSFTPMVLSEGRISLYVSTEVSELTTQGALDLGGAVIIENPDGSITTQENVGLTLPALKVRRAETTVELPSGGSLVMAGLIQDKTKQNIDGVPGLKDVPGLGALFRARDFESDETELVVIITPYLVDPANAQALKTPADGYATPSDAETIFYGRLSRVYGDGRPTPGGQAWRGPAGFILDDAAPTAPVAAAAQPEPGRSKAPPAPAPLPPAPAPGPAAELSPPPKGAAPAPSKGSAP